MKAALFFGLVLASSAAPFQCASDPVPEHRLEDSAPEALWLLAERFHREGNEAARQTALNEIIVRYPNSHEATRARELVGPSAPAQ